MNQAENSSETNEINNQPGTSSENELEDLNILNFPSDIDWSTTLVLRCNPDGAPYKLIDVANALHFVVRRNDVFNLGPTTLNYVFILSFKHTFATENFVRRLKDQKSKPLTVKNLPCLVTRVPSKCIVVNVRWIPADLDTAYIADVLKKYGTIVKTDMVKNDKRGWFHVYTGERRFTILLKPNVSINDLPFGITVKGLFGAVYVAERNPRCLECYYSGHSMDSCKYKNCPLNKEQ